MEDFDPTVFAELIEAATSNFVRTNRRQVRKTYTGGVESENRSGPRVQEIGSEFQPLEPDWQFVLREVRRFSQFTLLVTVWEDVTRMQNM